MNKLGLTASALLLAAIGSAGAADLPVKAPPMAPPPPLTWTGCYISGGIGYGLWNQDHFTEDQGVVLTDTTRDGGRGWLGRVGVGCDYQFNSNFLVGAFGDYDWSSLKGTSTQDLSNTLSPFFGVSGDEKQTGAWAAGVRLGYLPYPNLLTYVSGGWTQARFGEVDFFNHTANGFGALGIATGLFLPATTYNGWFIGAGYEYRLPWWQNLTWKTEYRYSEYSSKDILDQCGVISCGPIGVQTFGENSQKFVQTVTTSLVWRFNFGGASY